MQENSQFTVWGPLIWYESAQVRLWILLNINNNDSHHMGMSQMCTGAGDYFGPSKPHSGTLWLVLVGNLQKVKHLAKKLTNYKKSKTADLSQNIDACNNESTELHRSRNSIQVQVALLLHSYHVRSRYKWLQRDDLDMEDMFHDSERDGRRKSSFIEHISNLLKSIL